MQYRVFFSPCARAFSVPWKGSRGNSRPHRRLRAAGPFTCADTMSRVRVRSSKARKLDSVTASAERYQSRHCASCGDPMPAGVHGPLKTYCSGRCRKRAERARTAARAGLPARHPSLKAATAPARSPAPPVAVPRPRPAPAPGPPQPVPTPAAVPCLRCGRAGRAYRLRGYTPGGHLVAETAALCRHCRGLAWAMWQSRFGMPAITPA